jgi:hypothetical protein
MKAPGNVAKPVDRMDCALSRPDLASPAKIIDKETTT